MGTGDVVLVDGRCEHAATRVALGGRCIFCWHDRALAAEQEAAALRQERDEALVNRAAWLDFIRLNPTSLAAKIADRDQQIAALREEVEAMRPVVEAAAKLRDEQREQALYPWNRAWALAESVDAWRTARSRGPK